MRFSKIIASTAALSASLCASLASAADAITDEEKFECVYSKVNNLEYVGESCLEILDGAELLYKAQNLDYPLSVYERNEISFIAIPDDILLLGQEDNELWGALGVLFAAAETIGSDTPDHDRPYTGHDPIGDAVVEAIKKADEEARAAREKEKQDKAEADRKAEAAKKKAKNDLDIAINCARGKCYTPKDGPDIDRPSAPSSSSGGPHMSPKEWKEYKQQL